VNNHRGADTAPSITRTIATLSPLPLGATEIGAFSHPTRPEVAGKLVRFAATGAYAIVSGRTLTRVPAAWAKEQAAWLRVTAPTPECAP